MHNQATAEVHNHGAPAALAVGALLCAFGMMCLALVYVQGMIYTRESQLTRERAEYQQQQIEELRDRVRASENRVLLLESRMQRLMEDRANGR